MEGKRRLAPSILAADFMHLQDQIDAAKAGGAEYLHFDVMDGVFVPAISFGMPVMKCVKKGCTLPLDVHLMITQPERYVTDFVRAGADILTVHYEAVKSPARVLEEIRTWGVKAGLAISPETPGEEIRELLPVIDQITVMTVRPGFGGQTYIPECIDKVRQIAGWVNENDYAVDIEVDGGVKHDNVDIFLEAGANVIVTGSAVFKGNVEENVRIFMEKLIAQ
ncbi:MAG: ribulose-phosphate 3-epimerase [Lachnospiraceae bacterium]|nr:ribulose-phosphate 3-epimerase [Lachnospiraceae bacterium]